MRMFVTGVIRAAGVAAISACATDQEQRSSEQEKKAGETEVDSREYSSLFHGHYFCCLHFVFDAALSPY